MAPRRLARRIAPIVGALIAALALTACGENGRIVAHAAFDDVVDLAVNGAVTIADVSVGRISSIDLDEDNRAVVELLIDEDVELPSRVVARLRKTNVLGERFVELVPDPSSGGRFEPGSTIEETVVVPEIEEAVFAGTDVIVAISADTLAGAIQSGAAGLDGRGETLGSLISELGDIVASYDRNSDDLVRLLDGFEQFLAEVGPQADLHGRSLAQLADFTRVLSEEDERLIDALTEIRALANSGTDIMRTHRQRTDDFFIRFQDISAEIARNQDLERLFHEFAGHNYNTIRGVNAEHAQIISDFIVCGINDTPGDGVRACDDPPQAGPRPVPRPPQDY
jgi:phospholipid/cholesterol/gamma-HCH transport system substrate-binding protein